MYITVQMNFRSDVIWLFLSLPQELCMVMKDMMKEEVVHSPDSPNLPLYSLQTHVEDIVNACCYHIWASMLWWGSSFHLVLTNNIWTLWELLICNCTIHYILSQTFCCMIMHVAHIRMNPMKYWIFFRCGQFSEFGLFGFLK